MEDRIKILAECELFKTLPPEALEMVAARCYEGEAEAGEALVVEGKPADGLYVIVEGNVDYIKKVDEKRGLVHPHHSPDFDVDEEVLELGARLLSTVALRFLS